MKHVMFPGPDPDPVEWFGREYEDPFQAGMVWGAAIINMFDAIRHRYERIVEVSRKAVSAAVQSRLPTTPHDVRAIAVEAGRDPRVVQSAYEAQRVSANARAAIANAAARLGFAPPPEAR